MNKLTFPTGTYYVGDLCYVFKSRWSEVCDHICGPGDHDSVFTMKDGTQFASLNTKYGDGSYDDQFGKTYCVDAGIIGCVSADAPGIDITRALELGNLVTFSAPFTVGEESDGVIRIGHITIDTNPKYEDDDED